MREMSIDSIRVSLTNYQRVVILKVNETDRYLPIWIGPNEAEAIALKLQDVDVPRPLTHDLLSSVLEAVGASVNRIIVSDLTNDTFFAKIVVAYNDSTVEIDARPSDAIALAVRTKAPIFAEDEVLEKASVEMDAETGKAMIVNSTDGPDDRPLDDEELRRLSAFTDFIDTLNLEDLGEDKPSGASG
ncbi:MAG: bifunctional nuclease family protein [SAR202 cluster bacterium]|nr:bifunctional nuclease family protein [SAR202 cluster bacterium]